MKGKCTKCGRKKKNISEAFYGMCKSCQKKYLQEAKKLPNITILQEEKKEND